VSARAGRPFLLETVSERLKGHSVVDPAKYRTKSEADILKASDPVAAFAVHLIDRGLLTEEAIDEIDTIALSTVAEAVAFAEASPHASVDTLFNYTYATDVPNDSRRLPGQPLFEPAPVSGSGATR
jgi:pyruvate dehydrogenase E1 component alpha subunit